LMKIAAPEMQKIAESGSLSRGAVRDCWNDFSQGHVHWSRAWALTVRHFCLPRRDFSRRLPVWAFSEAPLSWYLPISLNSRR
jgi:hypothetical protein